MDGLVKHIIIIILFQLIKVSGIFLYIIYGSISFGFFTQSEFRFSIDFFFYTFLTYLFPPLSILGNFIFKFLPFKINYSIVTALHFIGSLFFSFIPSGFLFVIPGLILTGITMLFSQIPLKLAIKDLPKYKSILFGINHSISILFFFGFICYMRVITNDDSIPYVNDYWNFTEYIEIINFVAIIISNIVVWVVPNKEKDETEKNNEKELKTCILFNENKVLLGYCSFLFFICY